MSVALPRKIGETLADNRLQLALYTNTGRLVEKRRGTVTDDVLPEYQELRTHANHLKKHTIDNLDRYYDRIKSAYDMMFNGF